MAVLISATFTARSPAITTDASPMRTKMIQGPRCKTIAWGIVYGFIISIFVLQAIGYVTNRITDVPDRRPHEMNQSEDARP